jgi:hypothetical protein
MKPDSLISLKRALQYPVAYHRVFARVGGGATAGLFLSQCRYWTLKATDLSGWWMKTQAEWENEIGLTRREQETARRQLRALGILEERKTGVPARSYFRLNLDRLAQLIEQSLRSATQAGESAIPGWRIPPYKGV